MAAATTSAPSIDQQFEHTVKPFVGKYCVACHSGKAAPAQFDLKSYSSVNMVTDDFARWALLAERLKNQEMPPKPMPPPPAAEAQQVVDWVAAVRAAEIKKTAGDPGVVLARRLSNAEYDYTIRDLTGQDMHVAKEFPVDPANQAGFDNSGESLTMSPALLNKYLKAAREVADHAVLEPDGIDFAPYPMLVETDREKYAIQRIVSFYLAQPTEYADYFQAAWRYKYCIALKKPNSTLATTAVDAKVSPKYLPMVWQILHDPNAVGPILKLQKMWLALPRPAAEQTGELRAKCAAMRDFVMKIRAHTAMQFAAPVVAGLPGQSEPLLNWKLKQFAEHRRDSDPKDLRNDTDPPAVVPEIPGYPKLHEEAAPRWAALSAKARANDTDLIVPAAQRARYEAAFARFAWVFPDTFYVTERGRYFPDDSEDKGRLLSAGYHNTMGYYRDDLPLQQLILDDNGKKELDHLWNEFDYIADISARTWTQYYYNQSGEAFGRGEESGSDRPTGHAETDPEVIFKLRDAYLAKAAADPTNALVAAEAIRAHFDGLNATLRSLEKERAEAEPRQLEALLQFAARAYRRPITLAEKADLLNYYHQVRTRNQASNEDAMRDVIISVLMEPDFLYRLDISNHLMASAPARASHAVLLPISTAMPSEPLTSYELASRLSYFLWASMPDEELLRHAAANDLQKPAVLQAQARRMMRDPRVRGLATEFTGNWLAFRLFETNNAVDRERFSQFNNDLREAMFQEPIRYVEDSIQNNRSVLDLIYGDYTFVNPVLARHYGIPEVPGDKDHWVRVDDAGKYGRGGLLLMAVFMTQNSPGLRTSPVKRGNWVVQKVLGIRVPPPPPVVPELPSDESKTDLPIRQMLAKHRSVPFCAACHQRFDSFGLAYEGYGPIGDMRTKDLAGRPVDTAVTYPGGVNGVGFEGLRNFIRDHRQDQFLNSLCRKLLSYSLDRSLQLSDEALIDSMQTNLARHSYGFDSMVETIVMSPQFRNKRIPAPPAPMQVVSGKVNFNMSRLSRKFAFPISRRAVLRGAGCTVALPWLESLHALADVPPPSAFPTRFGIVFLGCGINEDHWSAEGQGASMKLSKTLAPLEPLKEKINVIDGLYVHALTGQGIHPGQTGSLLSGAHISKGAIIHSGISVDQMIANHVGEETPQSSIVLACDQPMTGYHESNFSLAYSSHISWQSPDSPVPVEVYPSLAWDNLFDNRGSLQNLSILDRVKDRAQDLSKCISSTDKGKLDEYLTSVREVEKRVEGMRRDKADADDAAKAKNTVAATMERPANGLPEDLRDHSRLMCDIIAIAFQTNKTRVASLIISHDLSAMYYPFLNVKDGHHSASHNNNSDDYERISRFHVEQYAYLASKLDSMKEGNSTVLDNTCLMFLSNMWIGRKHDNFRLPLVLAGGLGGTLQTGRTLNYLNDSEDNRKMCSLYLSLMDRYGLKLEQFGDSQTRLERL